jgi:hypothetical protein
MKRKLKVSGLLSIVLIVCCIYGFAGLGADTLGVQAPVLGMVSVGIYLCALMLPAPSISGVVSLGIQKEIWENHIEGNLFRNNEFLLASVDESQYVLGGKVVHIPQAGAKANIQVNRSSLPATVVQRTDTDITYNLDVYTSDPILIPNADLVELSYDKRESVLMEHEESLNEVIADYVLTKWAPATNIVRTTGIPNNDPTASPVAAHTPGATGNRLKFGLYDLKAIATRMDKANVSRSDRYGILDVDMYSDLVDDLIASKYRDSSVLFDAGTNELKEILGFRIFRRSSVVTYNNSITPVLNAYGAAGVAADNAAGLFWQKNAVGRAKGPTKFFSQSDSPVYYGDLFSFLQRMGARIRRANEENIIALVQTAA